MALATRLRSIINDDDPDEVVIPRLADDAEFAAATALLSSFETHLGRLERERKALHLEHYFANRQIADNGTDKMLREQLRTLRAEAPLAPTAAPAAPASPSPAIAAGLAILAGERVEPAPDLAARRRELDRMVEALSAAINEQTAVRDTIAAELSVRYCREILPAWNAQQVRLYRCGQELSREVARVRALAARIAAAGIQARSDILCQPPVRGPLMLGSEDDFG